MDRTMLVILGSPRVQSNSELIAAEIARGFSENGGEVSFVRARELTIKPCTGCLKCNNTGKCEQVGDDWLNFLERFRKAGHIVLASPIYFQHLPGELKILLDRFRSQVQIQMTPTGLIHNPRWQDQKRFAFVFSLGDRRDHDVQPALNMLTFWASLLGTREEDISVLIGYGLAVQRQIILNQERLSRLYLKLGLPEELAAKDYEGNQDLLRRAYQLGIQWSESLQEQETR